ncbi:type IV pilus biogenesis protein PilP [Escherichia coli]|nr:type IV pilus biogenesis protein PilP [Escherichia coli]
MHVKTKALLLSVILFPVPLLATTENSNIHTVVPTPTNVIQIELIQAETVLYEAQLAREKARNELRTLGDEIPATQGYQQNDESGSIKNAPVYSQLKLKEIFGIQPQLYARIKLPGGVPADVKAGQNLPGTGYKVEQITQDTVVLERDGVKLTLRP